MHDERGQEAHEGEVDGRGKTGVHVSVFLVVLHCDPDVVTHILGIQPSRAFRKGEVCLSSTGKRVGVAEADYWRLHSPSYTQGDLSCQVDSLLDLLAPHIAGFAALPPQREVVMECLVTGYTERPSVLFSEEQVRFLAQIGACIDVDIYDYSMLCE